MPDGEGMVWAWLGGRNPLPPGFDRVLAKTWPPRLPLALGEPTCDLSGWRLTHQQARAALPIAQRSPEAFVRYADVAVLASICQDEVLTTSLRELYLAPLEQERDGGEVARETLRAYFVAGRNAASAAAALGVSRQAVTKRLRAIEVALGRPLAGNAIELEAALRIEALDASDKH